jgi:hypothetical protein
MRDWNKNRLPVEKDYAHGWRGNTTDTLPSRPKIKMQFSIRGIATPSVGLILIW